MVRAATAGMIDFSAVDPWDMWWWTRLQWTLDELETQLVRDLDGMWHRHWTSLVSNSALTDEAFDASKANATTALNSYTKALFPWLADEIGEEGTKNDRERAVDDYHELFGQPGEERYERMLFTLYEALKKGQLTPAEKARDRKRREARQQKELQERFVEQGIG